MSELKKNDEDNSKEEKLRVTMGSTYMGYTDLLVKLLKPASLKELAKTMKPLHSEFLPNERSEELKRMIKDKNVSNSKVIKNSGVTKDYFYSIYLGKRNPSRNKTIQLCFGLALNGKEANLFLKKMGHNELYLRDERDAIVYYALSNEHSFFETEDFLFEEGYETITSE